MVHQRHVSDEMGTFEVELGKTPADARDVREDDFDVSTASGPGDIFIFGEFGTLFKVGLVKQGLALEAISVLHYRWPICSFVMKVVILAN